MSNCIKKEISFKGIKSKKLQAAFTEETVTSDAGLLFLRQAEKNIGIVNSISKSIKDTRCESYVKHSLKTMLTQRVFAIACGYEDVNDHIQLRKDAMFKIGAGKNIHDPDLAGASTLCRLENSVTREDLIKIAKIFVENFIQSYKNPPQKLILDFDATDDPVHGSQEHKFYHGYYRSYCFLPLYIYCGDRLVLPYLRPSDKDQARHAWAILSLLVKRLRTQWPDVEITFRADSGFCRHKMLSWCDNHNVKYIVGITGNSRLKDSAERIIDESRQLYSQTGEKVRFFGEIQYGARTWNTNRRVIVKAEQLQKGENIRFVVTNIKDLSPKELYDKVYVMRGDMENRIKEQQLDLFADRTSCHKFLSNQFRLFLSSAAYVLMEYIRRVGLIGTRLEKSQCSTIRLKLLKVGAVITSNSRRILIKISQCFVYKDIFIRLAYRL